ncbi:GNAT family N-acetyltransferase [Polymorphospora rubra]|uniref:GNAT family N-acetyltransferase n=1 Tax=Polymorphospora rubra TaxID=338584 RepID=UPI0033FB8617
MALWRIRATVDDRPGYLSVLAASLALRSVNILAVQVHTTEAGAVDDFLVDAPDNLDEAELLAAVERGRGRDAWVARAEAQGLADQPTRVLGLAARLVRDPDCLGELLRNLLAATAVTWRPTAGRSRAGFTDTVMGLPDPTGGCYEIRRAAPVFTPAEYARAQALVDLASSITRRTDELVTVVLTDGAEVTVRPAGPDDAGALAAMHERCSARSRRRRYLAAGGPSPAKLRRLLDPAHGVTLVAVARGPAGGEGERIVAMADMVAEGRVGEVAILVEDAWQGRGLGTALLRRLVTNAGRAGFAALVAHAHADNVGMLRTVARMGRPGPVDRDGDLVTVTLPLVARVAAGKTTTPAAVEA